MHIYQAIILLSLLSVVTTCLGVLLALWVKENKKLLAAGIGFSCGIMILISLLELIPEAHASLGVEKTLLMVFLGVILVWSAHLLIPHTHLTSEKGIISKKYLRSTYLIIFGLILHDIPEGFAMANAYLTSPKLGTLVGLGIALHNLPEEFAMSVPAVAIKNKSLLFKAAFFSALAEPAGAIVGIAAVGASPFLTPYFMAFAAGAMLFISLHELIPMAKRYQNFTLFLIGILISALTHFMLRELTLGKGFAAQ